jgi:signal transduction histidine kinase
VEESRASAQDSAVAAGRHPAAGGMRAQPSPIRRRLSSMVWTLPGASAPSAFVASLADVASVISSKQSLDDVLAAVVDETKAVTGTDKVVLCLFANDGCTLDEETVVVRGKRDMHPELWWRERLGKAAAEAVRTGAFVLVSHRRACIACAPIRVKDEPIGVLAAINSRARGFSDDEASLLNVLAAFAGVAIHNARLIKQSQYALLAEERDRMAKDLHDGLSQSLFAVSLALELCRREALTDPELVLDRLREVQELIADSMAELRRCIYDLRPVNLSSLGLAGSINVCLRDATKGKEVVGRLYIQGEERPLDPTIEACLYRVCQEAVANAIKHGRPRSVVVMLKFAARSVELLVQDDGRGFDPKKATGTTHTGLSMGLRSMRERVQSVGGVFGVKSRPNNGTVVTVQVGSE